MSIPKFAVGQPVLVNLVAISMVVIGGVTLQGMNRESIPTMPTGWGSVSTVYAGASPDEIERLITIPIENAVDDVEDIEELESVSREGLSYVYFKFDASVTDIDRKMIEVSNEVNRVQDLPVDADRPSVREFKVDHPTLAIAVRGDVAESTLRQVGKNVADQVERIDGVSGIWRNGIREREMRVEVDPDRLAAYKIPLASVWEAMRLRGANVPAGVTDSGFDSRLVRGMTMTDTAEAIRKVVIRPDPDGGAVRVSDVATVRDTYAPGLYSGRVSGEPGIVLTVKKEEQSDSIRISADVHELLERIRQDLPAGVTVQQFGDAAHEVRSSLNTLYSNAAVGLLLVLALLWFFVGSRNAVMAALGLPVALAGAVAAMNAMGITINNISLLALILCLGVVVDDAIIIIENIYRHMEAGLPRRQAAIVGTQEVFWPVVSSTLTTWAAFLPMLLMTGVLGKFFAIIPKVVVASLAASLIEAMFILPSHMSDFGRLEKRPSTTAETRSQRIGRRVQTGYESLLRWSLHHRRVVVGGCYLLCFALIGTAAWAKDVMLFNEGDVDTFDVRLRMPSDATKEETETMIATLERRILDLNDPNLEATVGVRGITRTSMGTELGDHAGLLTVFLVPPGQRESKRSGRDLRDKVTGLYDDIVGPRSLEVVEVRPGPPRGAPVAIRVIGNDYERIVDVSEQVLSEVRKVPGTRNANHNYALGKQELQVYVDEERAALHGMTSTGVSQWLRSAFGASPAATLRDGDDEIDIVVQLAPEAQKDPARIEALHLITPSGDEVALRELADVHHGQGAGAIRHYDKKRVVSTLAYIDEELTTTEEVNETLQTQLAPLQAANPALVFEYGGQYEETGKSVRSLLEAFLVALLLIYTILATQFQSFSQPFVVMAAIPLSLMGVTLGLLLSPEPVSLIALVGAVGLVGIVVNDSLVLVDFINARRAAGSDLDEAIVDAGKLRLRPIFLTSITTIAGLLPLALAGESAAFLAPMAKVIVWGLTFSTVLTLVVIPCMYRIDVGAARRLSSVFAPFKAWVTDPGAAATVRDSTAE